MLGVTCVVGVREVSMLGSKGNVLLHIRITISQERMQQSQFSSTLAVLSLNEQQLRSKAKSMAITKTCKCETEKILVAHYSQGKKSVHQAR